MAGCKYPLIINNLPSFWPTLDHRAGKSTLHLPLLILWFFALLEEKDAEIEDQKTQISNLVKTIGEGGAAARGGLPKKGRKSVNFKIPPKGAQSSRAMGRSQFNQTKINHRDQDRSQWMNQSVPTNGASAERVIIFIKI